MAAQPAEIAQIAVYLAKDQATFATVVDPEAGLQERSAFRQFDFTVDGASCRFVYFEKTARK